MSLRGGPYRLAQGGQVDRNRSLSFRFDGREYSGYAGDSLASALLASGVRLFGRSFKYHRPRGVLTAGSDEPNALVELRTGARREPNTRATVVELFEGCVASSQNRWPSLAYDIGAVNSLLSPLFVAGFYYKTFMWPRSWWEKVYEPAIRAAAGLGRASPLADPDSYEHSHLFCDLLVIGAGPAGLAAALTAARAGARVVLCEEDFLLGGRLNSERLQIAGQSAVDWARNVEAELRYFPDVHILRRTTVFGVYDGDYAAVERVSDHHVQPPQRQPRQRLWSIVARRCVLASGAIERPVVFGSNDLPGIMMASAVRTYLNRYGVAPGQRAAVFTATDDGWKTAADLAAAGVLVEAVIDSRMDAPPAKGYTGRTLLGAQVVAATGGADGLRSIVIRDCDNKLTHLSVDALAVSGGWNPNISLTTHLGGKPAWSESLSAFVPGVLPGGMAVAGAASGAYSLSAALQTGSQAGADATVALGLAGHALSWRTSEESTGVVGLWFAQTPGAAGRSKAFVDFQNDVTADDIALAAREGFRSVELLKRYTTLGMATDQGKTSSLNGHAIMAALTGLSVPELGTTTFRPPYTPVAIAAFAGPHRGRHSRPTRLTPAHEWARDRGARFVESGEWLRASWFSAPGETNWLQSATREVLATRTRAGVCDVSTLGKIDVQGADAALFLDRIYINRFSSLPVGRCRYGLMLREDGFVLDDGTTAHLAPGRYLMSTTTANAGRVMQHLEHARQVLWPELDVQLASVTEQWAQLAVAGPQSREVLQVLLGDSLDVSNTAFPYLACAEFSWKSMPARLFRISFCGELAYELAVPASHADRIIRAIMQAGERFGITPYGLEALNIMRIEKGHVTGAELNGTTTAADLGFRRMLASPKDCIGKVLSQRPALLAPERPVLVGIQPVDRWGSLNAGAHLLTVGHEPTLQNDQGYVTSAAWSPTLQRCIGLGLLAHGRERLGERIRVYDPLRKGDMQADIVRPVFLDPDGTRLRA